jgi:hypothetical protein
MTSQPAHAPLPHRHLITLTLQVGAREALQIGPVPAGRRVIAPVMGGHFDGERLRGEVLPGGADWVTYRTDGVMLIDVRLPLKTHDGALLYLSYQGRFLGKGNALTRLAKGEVLDTADYSLVTTARLESGAPAYAWLNDVIAVGTGRQSGFNPVYTIYEIGPALT